ncbi:MAG TPA: PqqD family protein [Gemmatimonadaceae bacterium]|jgi:Coenzyme PQQ synthesis protein D (PqqD).
MLARYRLAPDALFATLSDGAVVLDIQSKRYYSLNDTGARVWAFIREGLSAAEMVAAIVNEYEVEESDARAAIEALLQSLAAQQLIEPATP